MKRITYVWFTVCLFATLGSLAFYRSYLKQNREPESDQMAIAFCKNANRNTSHPNNHSSSLISRSFDPKDLVLCPGDTFGDLNNTYVEVKDCYLAMYYQDKMIWSSKMDQSHRGIMRDHEKICAFSLQRDGNLALYKEGIIYANPGGEELVIFALWDSQTNFHPVKTELTIQDQQVKVIQTFKDGTERSFYADRENQEFKESLGAPIKVADKVITKSHLEDNIILRRNEYIGDLNHTHLILMEDCQLQLRDKNKTLWSFIPTFRHEMNCVLSTQRWTNSVAITTVKKEPSDQGQDLILGQRFIPVVQTKITFDDSQPIIIQTLKNGSELLFTSGPGENIGLKLTKEPKQIAEKTLYIPKNGSQDLRMERMDYIGNLTGLHLILEQNCSLILRNANQKIWDFHPAHDSPLMDCSIEFQRDGYILLKREWSGFLGGGVHLMSADYSTHVTGYQLTLENNQLIIIRQRTDRAPDLYHADSRTRGVLFQAIAEHSVTVTEQDQVLPKMGYIGDLDGVYAIFEENCNWVLYNKTQIVWETGISFDDLFDRCQLVLKRDGAMAISPGGYDDNHKEKPPVWSSLNTPSNASLEKRPLKTELRVDNAGLYLINTFNDGTVNRYKALGGTHNFGLQSEKDQLVIY